jgi:hypothetical protein
MGLLDQCGDLLQCKPFAPVSKGEKYGTACARATSLNVTNVGWSGKERFCSDLPGPEAATATEHAQTKATQERKKDETSSHSQMSQIP